MKPIIIIKETNKDGKFELTEQELKELIEQAYKQGVEEGKAQYQPNLNSWQTRKDITLCKNTQDLYPVISDKPCITSPPCDVFGNYIVSCSGGTASDPKDNRATLNY